MNLTYNNNDLTDYEELLKRRTSADISRGRKRITSSAELHIGMIVECTNGCCSPSTVFINSLPYPRAGLGDAVDYINLKTQVRDSFFLHDKGIDHQGYGNKCYLEREFDIESDLVPGDIVSYTGGVECVFRGYHNQDGTNCAIYHVAGASAFDSRPARHFTLIRRPVLQPGEIHALDHERQPRQATPTATTTQEIQPAPAPGLGAYRRRICRD